MEYWKNGKSSENLEQVPVTKTRKKKGRVISALVFCFDSLTPFQYSNIPLFLFLGSSCVSLSVQKQ
jgi:hypothetical protein